MLRNYQIVIFKDHHGVYRKLRFRGWLFAIGVFLLAACLMANVYFFGSYLSYKRMEKELILSEKVVQDQKTQLLSLSEKVRTVEADLSRIRDFDAKLRQMINLDQEPRSVAPVGSPDDKDFTKKYLPLFRQEMMARKLHQFLAELGSNAKLERVRQDRLLKELETRRDLLSATPSIWPTEGWISSEFGERVSPFTGKKEFHKGLDISATPGTPVYATASGKVSFAGDVANSGQGVVLDHRTGLSTAYNHLRDLTVSRGETVTRGQIIGSIGETGQSTGPHLHYEVRVGGVPVNPKRFILD